MDLWVHITLEGYIIEFPAENHKYFSKEEVVLYEGPKGRLLHEIPNWINILLTKKGMLSVPSVEMAV